MPRAGRVAIDMNAPDAPAPGTQPPSPGSLHKAAALLTVALLGGTAIYWINRPDLVERGRRALERGDIAEACRDWEACLQETPDNGDLRMRLAVLYQNDNPQRALHHFEQIAPGSAHYLEAVRHIAFLSIEENDVSRAEGALRILAQHDPDEAAVRLALAELYYKNGRFSAALPEARAAAERQPERAETHLLIAEILDELDRVSEMVQPLRTAEALEPESYAVHANLAYALYFQGELAEALRESDWCLSQRADDFKVRRIRAAILRDQGEYEQALQQVRVALEQAPDDLPCRLLEADLLLFKGEDDAAYERLLPLYEQHRDNRPYLAGLVRAAVACGHREEATEYANELQSLIPEREGDVNESADPDEAR